MTPRALLCGIREDRTSTFGPQKLEKKRKDVQGWVQKELAERLSKTSVTVTELSCESSVATLRVKLRVVVMFCKPGRRSWFVLMCDRGPVTSAFSRLCG